MNKDAEFIENIIQISFNDRKKGTECCIWAFGDAFRSFTTWQHYQDAFEKNYIYCPAEDQCKFIQFVIQAYHHRNDEASQRIIEARRRIHDCVKNKVSPEEDLKHTLEAFKNCLQEIMSEL